MALRMTLKVFILLFLINFAATEDTTEVLEPQTSERIVSDFLYEVNQNLAELYNKEILAAWQNEIKGPNNLVALLQSEIAIEEIVSYLKSIYPKVLKFKRIKLNDEQLKRLLQQIPEIGYDALPPGDLEVLHIITANMSEIYKNVKLCDYQERTQCNLTLIPDVQDRLRVTKSLDEIQYYWLEWRDKTGTDAKDDFIEFVKLYRKTAKLNGFSKPSDLWFKDLEENSNEAISMLQGFFTDLHPIFLQYHAHVRRALRIRYGAERIPYNKPYPQSLSEIYIGRAFQTKDVEMRVKLPYPEVGLPNITRGLEESGLNNAQRVFWNVAEFYRSLGFEAIEDTFWENHAKPKADLDERYTTCFHRAWRFFGLSEKTFSYCPNINRETFLNMYETVGELYYYRAVETQPTLFQEEPFPNFSEALGKMFALAASTPKYLESLGIIEPNVYTKPEARINRLFMQGLRTVFLLPVFYVLDLYRAKILDNKINITDNCAYWQLVEEYSGAIPPVIRSNEHFDAPAKLLIEVDDQYTSRIMSTVLQFQLFKHFCEQTGQYEKGNPEKPLDLCNLSNQRAIGPIMFRAMSMGSSKPYKEILKAMTNETELKLDGLLAYFEPVYDWLKADNEQTNNEVGWTASKRNYALVKIN